MYISIALAVIALTLWWKLGYYYHGLFSKMNVKTPFVWPYVGHFISFIYHGMVKPDSVWSKKLGKIYGVYYGGSPFLMTSDNEMIKQAFIKDGGSFTDRFSLGFEGYPFNKSITVLKGDYWKRVRNILSPTFTAGKMKKMSSMFQDAIDSLLVRLHQVAKEKTAFDVKDYFSGLTIDIMARSFFALNINSQTDPDNEFLKNSKKLFNFSFANPLLMLVLIWPGTAKFVKAITPTGMFPRDLLIYYTEVVQKAIKERTNSNTASNYNDFLAMMMKPYAESGDEIKFRDLNVSMKPTDEEISQEEEISKSDAMKNKLTPEEILAQSIIFMVAGYETSATTLQYCAYFLAWNPEVQDKCRAEIREKLGDEELTYENMNNLKYLEQCLNETLRLCPPAPRIDRRANRQMTLKDSEGVEYVIPPGLCVSIPIYAIHHNSELWPEPEKFDPDRFEDESVAKNVDDYKFMPFGLGPRNCVGMRFAKMELIMAMASVLRKFKFLLNDKCQPWDKMEFRKNGLLAPKIPILLNVEEVTTLED